MDDTRLSILSHRSPPSQKEDDSALVFIASYNSREREREREELSPYSKVVCFTDNYT
jgi:hypothetical protein